MRKPKKLKWHQMTLVCKDSADVHTSRERMIKENHIPEAKLPYFITLEQAEERSHNMFSSMNRFTNVIEKDVLKMKQEMTDSYAATIDPSGMTRSAWIKKVDKSILQYPQRTWMLYKMRKLDEAKEKFKNGDKAEVNKSIEYKKPSIRERVFKFFGV